VLQQGNPFKDIVIFRFWLPRGQVSLEGTESSTLEQAHVPYQRFRLVRMKLEEEYHALWRKLERYGEEWPPTLLIVGTKISETG